MARLHYAITKFWEAGAAFRQLKYGEGSACGRTGPPAQIEWETRNNF